MADKEQILGALRQLDPFNDEHWTSNGDPRMDAVEGIVGDRGLTRKDIVEAAPGFNREKASASAESDGDGDGGEPKENENTDPPSEPNSEPSNPAPPGAPSVDPEEDEPGEIETPEEADRDTTGRESSIGKTPEVRGEVRGPAMVDKDEADTGEIESNSRWTSNENSFRSWAQEQDDDKLEESDRQLREEIADIDGQIEELRHRRVSLKRMAATARATLQTRRPQNSNGEAIREYIDSQNQQRARRLELRSEVMRTVAQEDLQTRAPIDAAMARNTKRGTQRPTG